MKRLLLKQVIILSVFIFASCSNEEDILCVEPPCGTIVESATNLTLGINSEGITEATISINDENIEIDFEGLDIANGKKYTCWQTIPNLDSETPVILSYILNGEVIFGVLNSSTISSNKIVIEINNESAEIKDYVACSE